MMLQFQITREDTDATFNSTACGSTATFIWFLPSISLLPPPVNYGEFHHQFPGLKDENSQRKILQYLGRSLISCRSSSLVFSINCYCEESIITSDKLSYPER
ncbi:hypothetical protein L1987_22676 [Smallanthus sonchifolius]|uniref:Uncharacterized protein n=1 Tax=Smallanthus sonchifolius TaxID=185202 RepID=A0ACB9IG30_9ASTR|nr:hypothetical protein L1987_22676 [Smallanthus sonchifolius]